MTHPLRRTPANHSNLREVTQLQVKQVLRPSAVRSRLWRAGARGIVRANASDLRGCASVVLHRDPQKEGFPGGRSLRRVDFFRQAKPQKARSPHSNSANIVGTARKEVNPLGPWEGAGKRGADCQRKPSPEQKRTTHHARATA